jgi:hypothetical protein
MTSLLLYVLKTIACPLMSVSDWESNSSTWVPQNLAEEILSIIDKSPIDLRRYAGRKKTIIENVTCYCSLNLFEDLLVLFVY